MNGDREIETKGEREKKIVRMMKEREQAVERAGERKSERGGVGARGHVGEREGR